MSKAKTRGLLLGILAAALIPAAILWGPMLREPTFVAAGVKVRSHERTINGDGLVTCSLTITNGTDRPVLFRAMLERLSAGGEWLAVPCSRPGPMYGTDLLPLGSGPTQGGSLPAPADDGGDSSYRMAVDYWPRESRVKAWEEDLRHSYNALLGRKAPDSRLSVFKGVGGGQRSTYIYWPARARINTETWKGVQPSASPNGGPPKSSGNSGSVGGPPSVS